MLTHRREALVVISVPPHEEHQKVRILPSLQWKAPSPCGNPRPDPPPTILMASYGVKALRSSKMPMIQSTQSSTCSAGRDGRQSWATRQTASEYPKGRKPFRNQKQFVLRVSVAIGLCPQVLWEVAQNGNHGWRAGDSSGSNSPQSPLCSHNCSGLEGQLRAPLLQDTRPRCFPGKRLVLPVWLNYCCFERLKQIIKMSRAIKTIKHKESLGLLQLRREEALLLLRVLGEKLSSALRKSK